jgi:hypothetical protein
MHARKSFEGRTWAREADPQEGLARLCRDARRSALAVLSASVRLAKLKRVPAPISARVLLARGVWLLVNGTSQRGVQRGQESATGLASQQPGEIAATGGLGRRNMCTSF